MCELLFDKCKCINVAWNSGIESIGPQAEAVSGIHLIELAIVAAGARDMASHFHLELLGENEAVQNSNGDGKSANKCRKTVHKSCRA